MTAPVAPAPSWLSLTTGDLARWAWQRKLRWPDPLSSSALGLFELPLDELLGRSESPQPARSRGEQRLLGTVAEILARPSYSAYAIRSVAGGADTYFVALARDDDAIFVVDTPGAVRLSRVQPNLIAGSIANQLPNVLAAPTVRMELPSHTAAMLAAGFARKAPERTLRSALASAGIPDVIASRLLAGGGAVRASGVLAAMRYTADGPKPGPRGASWTEMADGVMMSYEGRAGDVVWEPFSAQVVMRVIADAMASLGT